VARSAPGRKQALTERPRGVLWRLCEHDGIMSDRVSIGAANTPHLVIVSILVEI